MISPFEAQCERICQPGLMEIMLLLCCSRAWSFSLGLLLSRLRAQEGPTDPELPVSVAWVQDQCLKQRNSGVQITSFEPVLHWAGERVLGVAPVHHKMFVSISMWSNFNKWCIRWIHITEILVHCIGLTTDRLSENFGELKEKNSCTSMPSPLILARTGISYWYKFHHSELVVMSRTCSKQQVTEQNRWKYKEPSSVL